MTKFVLAGAVLAAGVSAQAFTCKEKVVMAVQGSLKSQEEYDVSARLETRKTDNDGNTQLWYVKVDAGIDGGGSSTVYVVTSGEGEGSWACAIKGIFGL